MALPSDIPDWSRETPRGIWDPGRKLLKTIRDYSKLDGRTGPFCALRRKLIVLRHRFWSAVTGCDIALGTDIGGGLMLPHPNGIVIHPGVKIGPNCLLMHQTTLGVIGGDPHPPVLGGRIDVGAGAKILGAVTIGDYALIGANAVVLKDAPAHSSAVGVPAKIIERSS